jgi:O-antigen/teichoic acid export membrane protein
MTAPVRTRFAFAVVANVVRSALAFATGVLLARWMGPESYGRMAFLVGSFLALRQLFDMGSSAAFFTFMAQRPRSRRFFDAFCLWLVAQFVVPAIALALLLPKEWIDSVWRGEQRPMVLIAFAAAFMQGSVWPVLQQAGESQRRTLLVQSLMVTIVSAHLVVVTFLWLSNDLGIFAVLTATAVEYLLGAIVVRRALRFGVAQERDQSPRESLARYWQYCRLLIPYAWVGFAYEFADRWLLQRFGGSVEQAYYAISSQFATIALPVTTSILNIFWKEIAEAHGRADHARTASLYKRTSRLLFMMSAATTGFLLPWTHDLVRLLLGSAYAGGAATLAVMVFYPIHQSLGQIAGAFLYATARVSWQVGIGVVFMLISIATTYFVLAPGDAAVPGLGLASFGLALKMVGLQLVQTNVIAYVVARVSKWHFDWLHQAISVIGCVGLGWAAYSVAISLAGPKAPTFAAISLGAVLYSLLFIGFVYSMPWLTGFSRAELVADAGTFVRKIVHNA